MFKLLLELAELNRLDEADKKQQKRGGGKNNKAGAKRADDRKDKPSKKHKRAQKTHVDGRPGNKRHDDGTELQFKKDRPFMKEPKKAQVVGSNMWFDMTSSGELAGDLE